MITIIDYGLGNLASVSNALSALSIPYQITSKPAIIRTAKKLLLPGVGSAGTGMKNLKTSGLDRAITRTVKMGTPLLGICLGMQLLFSYSEENDTECLGILKGTVKRFSGDLKVPQIGWNQVKQAQKDSLFENIPDKSNFYFVNSYYCEPQDLSARIGTTDYIHSFTSICRNGTCIGVQFHPEKSAPHGLTLLSNFYNNV